MSSFLPREVFPEFLANQLLLFASKCTGFAGESQNGKHKLSWLAFLLSGLQQILEATLTDIHSPPTPHF